jgi:riboflavin kinase/FMN adenylyltransferase
VVEGDGRGRQIGIPTANVAYPSHKLLPADGVYVTRTRLGEEGPSYGSVTNIGVRPTVDGLHHKVETHLLDFPAGNVDGNLYGRTVTIEFLHRLRGEQRFASLDDLISQIRADIVAAKRILATEST